MVINRRKLLASGTTLAGLSVLSGGTSAHGEEKAEVPKDAVVLTAMVKAKPGQEDAVKEALLSLVEPTRKESGCLCYNLHQSKADPIQFIFSHDYLCLTWRTWSSIRTVRGSTNSCQRVLAHNGPDRILDRSR